MPKQVRFQGQTHVFPDNFTDEQIAEALQSSASESKSEPVAAPERSVSDFFTNRLPGSAKKLVVDAVAGVIDTASAAVNSAATETDFKTDPLRESTLGGRVAYDLAKASPRIIRGLVQHYKDRYGSLDSIGDTVYEDPVGAVADFLPLGKPLELAGVAGKTRAVRLARKGAEEAVSNLPDVDKVLSNKARKRLVTAETTNRVAESKLHKASNVIERVGTALDKPIEFLGQNVVTPVIQKTGQKVKNLGTGGMVRAAKPAVADMREMPSGRQNISQARRDFVNALADNDAGLNADGLDTIRHAISDHNTTIDDAIKNKGEMYLDANEVGRVGTRVGGFPDVPLGSVERELDDLKNRFSNQVNPTADLEAIERVRQDFRKRVGFKQGDDVDTFPIPFDVAHELKKGTHQQLRGKFGELKSAEVEAQKALARGLKNEVAGIEPTIELSNKKLAELYPTERALEKVVSRLETSQPFGLREMAGIGGGVSAPLALASGNPMLMLGAALPLLWNLSRPEMAFPISKRVYKAGRRANEMNPATAERALRATLLARMLGISEEEAEALVEREQAAPQPVSR